jgi:hypothetical protein
MCCRGGISCTMAETFSTPQKAAAVCCERWGPAVPSSRPDRAPRCAGCDRPGEAHHRCQLERSTCRIAKPGWRKPKTQVDKPFCAIARSRKQMELGAVLG